jgi:hypothetical protein
MYISLLGHVVFKVICVYCWNLLLALAIMIVKKDESFVGLRACAVAKSLPFLPAEEGQSNLRIVYALQCLDKTPVDRTICDRLWSNSLGLHAPARTGN